MNGKVLRAIALLGTSFVLYGIAQAAEDEQNKFSLSAGFDFTSGKFGGTTTTKLWTIPITGTYDTENYSFDFTLPYLRQTGPTGGLIIRGRPIRGATGRVATVQGIGDVTASVTRYLSSDNQNSPLLDVKALIKFGTADATKGLGTGKQDYSIQGDLAQSYGAFTLSGTLGYAYIGSPIGVRLLNIYYGSLDGAYKISAHSKWGLTFNAEQTTTAGSPGPRDLTLYWNYNLTKASNLQLYVLKGLSDGSSDSGGGAAVTFDF